MSHELHTCYVVQAPKLGYLRNAFGRVAMDSKDILAVGQRADAEQLAKEWQGIVREWLLPLDQIVQNL